MSSRSPIHGLIKKKREHGKSSGYFCGRKPVLKDLYHRSLGLKALPVFQRYIPLTRIIQMNISTIRTKMRTCSQGLEGACRIATRDSNFHFNILVKSSSDAPRIAESISGGVLRVLKC